MASNAVEPRQRAWRFSNRDHASKHSCWQYTANLLGSARRSASELSKSALGQRRTTRASTTLTSRLQRFNRPAIACRSCTG
jgi:hypothetical protein